MALHVRELIDLLAFISTAGPGDRSAVKLMDACRTWFPNQAVGLVAFPGHDQDTWYHIAAATKVPACRQPLVAMTALQNGPLLRGEQARQFLEKLAPPFDALAATTILLAGSSQALPAFFLWAAAPQGERYEKHHLVLARLACAVAALGLRPREPEATRQLLATAEKEKEKLARQLQQAQKLEAIGTLAGGVAHDFNNLLQSIRGRCALIRTDVRDSETVGKQIDLIEDNVRSAAALTNSLLGYTRDSDHQRRALDINRVVRRTLETFGRTCKQIQIHTNLSPASKTVLGDRYQLEQLLANLSVNAMQAMPNGGSLTVSTEPHALDEATAKQHDVTAGRYVKLSVSDTGEGIAPDIQDKIFDPFFTTRPRGQGTGLGLASVLGIVKSHSGTLTVDSAPGRGTTFTIYLPAAADQAHGEPALRSQIRKGSGRVLLIDDEPMVLEVGAQMLRVLGYEAVQASGGQKALDICREQKEAIDIIILDMIMPAMGGEKAFAELKKICPRTPVVLSSGYSLDNKTRRLLDQGACGFLQKPFGMQVLSQVLSRALADSP